MTTDTHDRSENGLMAAGERLSALDSSYYYLDNAHCPQAGMGISVYEGTLSYDHIVARMLRVIPQAPRFLQRVVTVPFGLAYPTWEYDPDFDIRYHVQRVQIEPPGTDAQLMELADRILNEPLDLNRPLWRNYLIEGLSGGRSASINKMHHCLSDGMGAIKLMMANLELEPVPPPPLEPGDLEGHLPKRPPLPSLGRRVTLGMQYNAARIGRSLSGFPHRMSVWSRRARSRHFWQGLRIMVRYVLSPTVRFPFNRGLSGKVHLATASLPLAGLRAVRARCGGTVNDVLLASVAGALDSYATEHGYDTRGRYMRLQVPTNLRTGEDNKPLGNAASAAPVLVPFGFQDPIARLHGISEDMRAAKTCRVAYGLRIFLETWKALLTPPGMWILFSLFARPSVQRIQNLLPKKPALHLYVSNMPGPEFSTYTLGCRLLERYVFGPLIPASGLVAAAMTYNEHLHIGFTGDAVHVQGLEKLAADTMRCFEELSRAAGIESADIDALPTETRELAK